MSKKIYDCWKNSKYYSVKHKNYFPIYEELLSSYVGKKITFVEIGVLSGGSLFMWKNYFGENARIIGVELNPLAKKWEKHGFEIFIGDQGSSYFWESFFDKVGEVDIILDDGSHLYKDQIVTVKQCVPFIKNGGKMITEDTHSSYQKKFGHPSKYNFANFSKLLVNEINYRFPNLEKKDLIYTSPLRKKIFSISYYESIISFNIDENKCVENKEVDNGGLQEGEIHVWNYLEKSKIKLFLIFLSIKFKFLKKYKFFLYLSIKFHQFLDIKIRRKENKLNRKFFK